MKKLMDAACELEDIRSQLEYVTGVSKVCAVAYEQKDPAGSISGEETANAFYSINSQLKEITDKVNALIPKMLRDDAENILDKESQAD